MPLEALVLCCQVVFWIFFCGCRCFVTGLSQMSSFFSLNRKRYRLYIWHAYSTNDALSNATKANDLVTLNLTFLLKITFSDPLATGGIVFHKHIYFYLLQIAGICEPVNDPSCRSINHWLDCSFGNFECKELEKETGRSFAAICEATKYVACDGGPTWNRQLKN